MVPCTICCVIVFNIGQIRHRDKWYPGEHPGIVPRELWDRVQAQLDINLRTRRKHAREWLDPGMSDVSTATDLLKPYDARRMRCYPVSERINQVANDDEACSAPVELAQIQKSLFS